MAGKSNKGRNRRGSNNTANSSESVVSASAPLKDNLTTSESGKADANGAPALSEPSNAVQDGKESETTNSPDGPKQGELHLYPVSVTAQSGEKLELQLNPGDSVMDIRQFLLDAPETCLFTCYDLLLRTKDGTTHQLEDYNEISEVADITTGGCSLEMVAAPYDDRSIRAHVHRTRELLSLSTLHASLSTSLALEYENKASSSDTVKAEVPELDGLDLWRMLLAHLVNCYHLHQKRSNVWRVLCFRHSIPPSYRRLVGDLIYLDVVTLEGNKYCITGTTKSFYVNSSTGNVLDPRPSKATSEATTLIGLLQKISSKFKKAFREILERKASAHPFENVQSLLPPNSWLGSYPIPDHRRDAARAEDALTLSYGSELIGMQRDWNEELQSCREFPHTTPQERYVHNNIFFSFAVDADLEQLSKKHTKDINSKTESITSSQNSSEKVSNDLTHEDSGISNGGCDGSTTVEGNGVVESTPLLSSDTQLAESEQATYASANNDLKGTKAYQEADSVLPGILQGDKSDSLLYGSVDNGRKICWNEEFHSKVLEAAKRLHLKEHEVVDGSGNVFKLAAPVECKGIVGSDDRHYLLDLMRVTPRDANYNGPGSRFCILRPELIAAFCQAESVKRSKSKPKSEDEAHATADSSEVAGVDEQVKPVANFPAPSADSQEIAKDEENVGKASSYLADTVLPKFIQDLCTLEVSPMDGQTLTEALHAHGINVRYIGRVAEGTKHLPHLWDLCSNEIVVRSAKHILKDVLRDTEDQDLGSAISHFFNCFFGNCQAVGIKVAANSSQPRSQKKFELPEDARSRVNKISVIRNVCQKVGVTIAARKYDLNAVAPFQTSDILDLKPVVKHSVPVCSEAKDLVETGKVQLAEGMLSEAYTLFSEAFSILQQVTGPMHREVANCCRYLAMVLYHAGDMGGAIIQQHKELIINERCLGLDHPDTAHSYGNMALFYHGLNQTELALRHMSRALLLLSLSSGPDHPDVAATFINVAMMYQDIGKMNTALRYLQEALKKNERLLGEEHIQTAVCYHALAIAFNCMGAFKLSHQHEKKTYDILVKQLGEEDSRTRDSQNWMKTFKMRELQMNAQKQKGQALNATSAQKAIDILKAHPDLIQAFQAAAAAGGSGSSSASVNKSLNAAIIGETLPRGRGVDERAARAAAEVRKKAAARGLLIRPHGVPVQALPPLTQLLNIINSGMTPDAVDNEEANSVKKEANGQPSDGAVDTKKDEIPAPEDPAPVGLGKGLASLDTKKQKSKPKAAA
ncbi:hypothetical protein GH714_003502 [Hevea brasiliensis]|uniref:Clu domain-containing protein n=1 Tax=Hevea brasiliensis TaxID=3981 RepID=A0A6A6L077_HEVBR|nr:hypothetical protein GH714_003502 [Hevea brasiliensis]